MKLHALLLVMGAAVLLRVRDHAAFRDLVATSRELNLELARKH